MAEAKGQPSYEKDIHVKILAKMKHTRIFSIHYWAPLSAMLDLPENGRVYFRHYVNFAYFCINFKNINEGGGLLFLVGRVVFWTLAVFLYKV